MRRIFSEKLFPALWLAVTLSTLHAQKTSLSSWWPQQKKPNGYVTGAPSGSPNEKILLQALAGLAAQAVNEGRGDELVWMNGGGCYDEWKKRTEARLPLQDRGAFDVWKLLDRYRASGLVKGYIVYSADASPGAAHAKRDNADLSLNVATTLAGITGAVPVEASLESRLTALGLPKLADARKQTPDAVLKHYGAKFNRKAIALLDPKVPNMRDFAIAHRCFVDFMTDGATTAGLAWAEPLAPVVGWACGDEFKNVAPLSRAAHFHTASNWASEIPFLSAGSDLYQSRRIRTCDPRTINFQETRQSLAFLMSDGDNLCWMLGGFQQTDPKKQNTAVFWDSPQHGKFPMGWSAALGDLVDVSPVTIDRLAETQPPRTSITQFGGGYFYPDHFAADDPAHRDALLRKHAQRIAAQMRRTGAVTLTFICEKSDSAPAQQAMRIFAEEIHPLVGMLVMDYAPYHRMGGQIFWVSDGRGGAVPAVTARYAMWAGMKRPSAGGPSEVATAANQDSNTPSDGAWVAVHSWSRFDNGEGAPPLRGLDAVAKCVSLLDPTKIHVVTPEEMLWRVRYRHDPKGTQKWIAQWTKN